MISGDYPSQKRCKYEPTWWSPVINDPCSGDGGGRGGESCPRTLQEGATTAGFSSSHVPSPWDRKSVNVTWCDRKIMWRVGVGGGGLQWHNDICSCSLPADTLPSKSRASCSQRALNAFQSGAVSPFILR